MTYINRKFKDRLFRMVFREKRDLLDLYNAMNDSNYQNPDELEIVTLDDVIYMDMKNDAAFLINEVLSLWEHQSSWNPNMPLRGLFYLSDEYRKYIEKKKLNIYGSSLIPLPLPQYVVFYNGPDVKPERTELVLSQSFSPKNPSLVPCLEVKAVIVNINRGHNKRLMELCRKLWEYAEFTARVRDGLKAGQVLEESVDHAVQSCIRDGILEELLSIHRAEVFDVILTEYNEQLHIASEKKLSREEGLKEGLKEGIRASIVTLQELGASRDLILEKLIQNFNLSRENADKALTSYWREP